MGFGAGMRFLHPAHPAPCPPLSTTLCPSPRKPGLMLGMVTSFLPQGPSSEHKGGFVPLPHAGAGCGPARGLGVLPGG